jgi:signal transduction histidine kinase
MRIAIQRYRELAKTMERRVQERTDELMRTQQTLAHSQKMDAIGKLTGGVAHDFNNMLAVIMASLDLMKRRLLAGQTDVMRYVDSATEGVERAAQLTSRLLAFARKQPLAPEDVDVNKLLQNLSELLHRTLGETVALEYVGAAGLWRSHIDPAELERAIVNLAVNARDAMPDGGALTIETANAYLDEHYASSHAEVTAGQYVMISVSDKGTGMSPEVAARAMDPFFTTKDPTKGTGLGLSQVYGFVKQSNGHIAIYSEEGHGTTVRVYLPRAYVEASAAPAEGDAPADALPAGSAEVTVLVVEDDGPTRELMQRTIQDAGHVVLSAENGRLALTLLEQNSNVQLVVLDLMMPEMDGFEFLEHLRAHPAYVHVPVVVATAKMLTDEIPGYNLIVASNNSVARDSGVSGIANHCGI